MSRYFEGFITGNVALKPEFNLLTVNPPAEAMRPLPGQFYMLQPGDTYDPLLKRPLSLLRCSGESLQFLFRVRGRGTRILADMKAGSTIPMIGPLGNGYPVPGGRFIAVAGGIGIASVFSLLEALPKRAILFHGAGSSSELVMDKEAHALAERSFVSTDDGSAGERGFVTDLLERFLSSCPGSDWSLPVFACGPAPMLMALSRTVSRVHVPCYASLEERMACGVGACLSCVVKMRASGGGSGQVGFRYASVCKEGPVFDLRDVIW